ncbi:MAG TPA: ABC transporter permease [Acidisarcina sp.]
MALAARNFWRFRLQAVLITVASMTGTAGVIVSAGYAAGGRQKILNQFSQLGVNVIVITPEQSRVVGGRARTGSIVTTLTESDYKAIQQSVTGISVSSPTVARVFRIRAGNLTKNTTIVGCTPEYFAIKHWPAAQGDLFDEAAARREARVALLGATAARDLFGDADPTDLRITINRVPFIVAGVLAERGQGLDASSEDDQVYVPLDTAMHRLLNIDYYNSIFFEIPGVEHIDSVAVKIDRLLQQRHNRGWVSNDVNDDTTANLNVNMPELSRKSLSHQSRNRDFQIQNRKSLIETQLASFGRLTFLVNWVALSALAVSSLGVFAITWIGIKNRTREIGTRRAIGARIADILVQFFAEGMIGACTGCALGAALSYIALRIIDERIGQPFLFSNSAALWEVAVSLTLYSTFTLISSIRAIRVRPLEALRSE